MTTPVIVQIDASGITAVPFELVLEYFQSQFRAIYGADIVIEPSTQDGQLLGIYSQALDDTNNAAITAFNSFRPGFAVGAGLSSIVKINGLQRKIATNSQVTVTLGGTVGTTIFQAYVGDNLNLNTEWFVAGPVTIPPEGVINTTAYCTTQGAVTAGAGTITNIITPVPGWQTVTNPVAATPGMPVETDAELRRRQTKSTANPATTVRSSIEGNLLAVPTVERARVYENDQFLVDPVTNIPARCIACVVKGSDGVAIANAIAMTKPPGIPTYGNVTQTILDQTGTPATINYFPLYEIEIYALIVMKAVVGYSDAIGMMVQQSIANWVNNLDIGTSLHLGDIYSPANLDGDAATEATGRAQSALDPMGATYSIVAPYGLALARADMYVVGGPYTGNAVNVNNSAFFHVGEAVWLTLNNGTHQQTKITAITGAALTFADTITSTMSVNAGSLIYAVGDIKMDFYGAAKMSNFINNIELMVS
jgi:uncharacterized phage protein gp47/JayE